MSNYDFKILKIKEILNNEDLTPAWKIICDKLRDDGRDFRTVSMHPKKKLGDKWFHASSNQLKVLIERAKDPTKNSDVNMYYWIRQPEFEIIAKLFNKYVSDISNDIRYTDCHMSSYIITLIAELL